MKKKINCPGCKSEAEPVKDKGKYDFGEEVYKWYSCPKCKNSFLAITPKGKKKKKRFRIGGLEVRID